MQPWPCSAATLAEGRRFLQTVVRENRLIVLLPDRDADGLCAGAIVYKTLQKLGATSLHVEFIEKGRNVHQPPAMQPIANLNPSALIVLDQGSRGGPPLLPGVPTLVIDHHQSQAFPEQAVAVSSFGYEPIATSAMLSFELCKPLMGATSTDVDVELGWIAVAGTFGDLGSQFKFQPPWPDLSGSIKQSGGRKAIGDAVGLLNAPRRTANCDPRAAWRALVSTISAKDMVASTTPDVASLRAAKDEVSAEMARVAKTPPVFSSDGKLALVAVRSGAQVHPLLATRWARSLTGKRLVAVMSSNDGYVPDRVNFALRVASKGGGARQVRATGELNLIEMLKRAVESDEGLQREVGQDFARGHAQATGGSVPQSVWPRLLRALMFENENASGRKRVRESNGDKEQKSATLMRFGFRREAREAEK